MTCMKKEIIEFNQSQRVGETIDLRPGDVVRIHRKIIEGNKERIQIFEGMVIAIKGKQSSSPMVTARKISEGVGVEVIVPIYSPKVAKIEIVKRASVRRSKLYYIRTKPVKSLRIKYRELSRFAKIETKDNMPTKKISEVKTATKTE